MKGWIIFLEAASRCSLVRKFEISHSALHLASLIGVTTSGHCQVKSVNQFALEEVTVSRSHSVLCSVKGLKFLIFLFKCTNSSYVH